MILLVPSTFPYPFVRQVSRLGLHHHDMYHGVNSSSSHQLRATHRRRATSEPIPATTEDTACLLMDMASMQQGAAVHVGCTSSAVPPTDCGNSQTDKISTPVTPDQRFRAPHLRINSAEPSPDDGVALWPSDCTRRHPSSNNNYTDNGNAQLTAAAPRPLESTEILASPSRLANIRIRRSHHGSVLLQSPARAGHAARMRQMFETASLEQQTRQVHGGALYAQLPNVSRRASPPTEHNERPPNQSPRSPCLRRPESPCISTTSIGLIPHGTQVSCTRASEQSSESWSDDSGYFITGSRNRTSAVAFAPNDRIAEWLLDVAVPGHKKDGAKDQEYESTSPGFCQHFPSDFGHDALRCAKQAHVSRSVKLIGHDPFLAHGYGEASSSPSKSWPAPWKHVATQATLTIRPYHHHHHHHHHHHDAPTKHARTPSDGDVHLSPLSPNVCIERGPARYHSSRNLQPNNHHTNNNNNNNNNNNIKAASPTKPRRMRLKDKATVSHSRTNDDDDDENDMPTGLPCKVGVGTRFQHPRHAARGSGPGLGLGLGRWVRRGEA